MEIKNSNSKLVFSYETKTSLKNLMQAIGNKPNDLMVELEKQGINPAGPQIWTYEGCSGKPEDDFTLKITAPVAKKGKDSEEFKFEELPEYKFVGVTHKGAYSEFQDVYCKIMKEVEENNLIPDGTSREIYLNCDFENQANCVTEIQIGVK